MLSIISTQPLITQPVFTDTAILDVIQCSAGSTCAVPLIIKGEPGKIPKVDTDSSVIRQPIHTVKFPGKETVHTKPI